MFRLDYLSCLLTILATILVARKSWTGLLVSIVNSLIVCLIGLHTSQFGFIPANLICICVYVFSIRSWLKKTHAQRIRSHVQRAGAALKGRVVGAKVTVGQEALSLNSVAGRGYHVRQGAQKRKGTDLPKKSAVRFRHKIKIPTAKLPDSCGSARRERILRNGSRVSLPVNNVRMGTTAPPNVNIPTMNRMIALSAG